MQNKYSTDAEIGLFELVFGELTLYRLVKSTTYAILLPEDLHGKNLLPGQCITGVQLKKGRGRMLLQRRENGNERMAAERRNALKLPTASVLPAGIKPSAARLCKTEASTSLG
jgi:hypothetical protein